MVEIRKTRPEERRQVANVVSAALLHSYPDDESWAKSGPSWDGSDSLSAWDGDQCVGHAAGYRVETVVPGGARLATSAVSRVGVRSTARRRGVASGLMRRLLIDAAERGQVLASLRASEAVIYGRFGFGIAGWASEIRFQPRLAGAISGVAPGSTRILEPDEILTVLPPLYDRIARRPGIITRPEFFWRRYYEDALKAGGDAHYAAVHLDPTGAEDGFVHYHLKWTDASFEDSEGKGEVFDLFGASPGVELALWSFLGDIDLVRTWTSSERPVDDVVRLALANQRAFSVRNGGWDEQWLRLLDVDAALQARTYGDADAVIVAVEDDLLAANTGVWSIDRNGAKRLGGVRADAADLSTDVRTLAATYLGGFRWSALAAAGRVQVGDPEALARADALFLSPVAPFCGSFF
jgi:predicted acetyltransferase